MSDGSSWWRVRVGVRPALVVLKSGYIYMGPMRSCNTVETSPL